MAAGSDATLGAASGGAARTYLALTEAEAPGCPAGSAVLRVELDEVTPGAWPGLVLVPDDGRALWAAPPPPPPVPDAVPNADLRIVLQGGFLADGRSYFTAADSHLAKQRDDTASLPDDDPAKRAALAAWTQWDQGNQFFRADPLVGALGAMFGLAGDQLDELFRQAAARR